MIAFISFWLTVVSVMPVGVEVNPDQWLASEPITIERLMIYEIWTADPEPPPQVVSRPTPRIPRTFSGGVEQWRPLVVQHFPADVVDWALAIISCESQGNPNAKNPNSSASGLFQAMESWWSGEWGYPAFDPFDPVANVTFAGWLYVNGGKSHWECKA